MNADYTPVEQTESGSARKLEGESSNSRQSSQDKRQPLFTQEGVPYKRPSRQSSFIEEEKKSEAGTGPKMNDQGPQISPPGKQQEQKPTPEGPKFECNICYEIANEPVVTSCGHLYCWICIYQWMNQPKETLLCPVCKSGISKETVIPIYTKGNAEDPRKKHEIPKRPAGQRQGPVPNQNFQGAGGSGIFGGLGGGRPNGGFMMGVGLFPALFSMGFTWDSLSGAGQAQGNGANNEETREQQLQRLLGILMFFMFMSFIFFGGDVFLTF
ncbi:hypothetical protein FGO68_gene4063 [Halteria grandinella]|uniref:RING-type E3 ubiquitin transferase n=1 Tax=Halteria grandinella TaxID=5974 RepID=A0A8J8SZS7_HALGN|nr:hypothetical protein FGO68_gene4063 [Halteria grandinella]